MKSHARVVIIGGGVVGCSVLYHLARAGWTDAVLLERSELTSGSTWHAAGGVHTLNGDPNVAKLQQYTIELYKEIEQMSGQSCGLHLTGGIMLAGTEERLDWLKMAHARGRYLGMETEIISVSEAVEMMPLVEPKYFVGGMFDRHEGHLDPSGVTHAYAKSARKLGATIHTQTRVEHIEQGPDDSWLLHTNQGSIHCEHVVNAGGLWAREVGRMVGIELPVLAMEHMYLLTDEMPEVVEFDRAAGRELPHVIDFEGELYLRQERTGMLMGTYEKACRPWSEDTTPWNFDTELLQPDLDRIAPSLEVGFEHFPAFATAGIRQVINGPFTFAPDGNPLIGPVKGLHNYWAACGVMAGFSQGGGVGLALSNWMVHGDPGFDVWAMDVSRYGDWIRPAYTNAKVRENYSRRFRIQFPNEELPAGRPLKTTPIYDELKRRHAVFGDSWGLEHALWFAPDADSARDVFSFKRSNDFEHVGEECKAVREHVGMLEISNFANYEVSGRGAAAWLDRLLANKLPKRGRMALCPMLNHDGRIIGDFTLARLDDNHFYLTGSGVAEQYHMRWFLEQLPDDGVQLTSRSMDMLGLQIAGPQARRLLQRLTKRDVSAGALRFMAFDRFDIGMVPALVGRVSFTGELGYEIWVRPEYQRTLFHSLWDTGQDLGLRLFGGRALNSLRLEKSWGAWATEYRPIYTPFEAGMERFIDLDKGDFIGREAALRARGEPLQQKLVTLVVDAADADVIGDEPILRGSEAVGWVTSGGYAHYTRKSVAMGYIRVAHLDEDAPYAVEILGDMRPARIQAQPLYDPSAARMRG
ncbi:MAG: FAD-dependent oxidoreductase [Arenicellales bacterium]